MTAWCSSSANGSARPTGGTRSRLIQSSTTGCGIITPSAMRNQPVYMFESLLQKNESVLDADRFRLDVSE